jgi:hypothetical protein
MHQYGHKRLTAIEQQLSLLQAANQQISRHWEQQMELLRASIQANNKTTEQHMENIKEELSKTTTEMDRKLTSFNGSMDATSDTVQRIEDKTNRIIDTMEAINQDTTDSVSLVKRTINKLKRTIAESIATSMQQAFNAMMERNTPNQPVTRNEHATAMATSPERVHKSKRPLLRKLSTHRKGKKGRSRIQQRTKQHGTCTKKKQTRKQKRERHSKPPTELSNRGKRTWTSKPG